MTEIDYAEFMLKHGTTYSYAPGFVASDWAETAAMGIAADLCDRRGVKWEMEKVDDEVRGDIIKAHAAIIRAAAAMAG